MSERIGLFGGLFDPPHNGHRRIAMSFLASGYLDRLWVVPTAWPAHKIGKRTDFNHRYAMCGFAFADLPQLQVIDVESELPAPSFTIHTLLSLRARRPEAQFVLCMGTDQLHAFHIWHRWTDILKFADLLVVERIGFPTEIPTALKRYADSITFVRHSPTDHASMLARLDPEQADLPEKVKRYIQLNRLYG